MEDNQNVPVATRLNLLTIAEVKQEIQGTSKSLSDWFKEAIEEKLTNDNRERLKREIKIKEDELTNLKKREQNFIEKEKIIQKIPQAEVSFFIQTKKIIDQDPNFILGRISLYKNKFNKNHLRISVQDFIDMITSACNQYEEKAILEGVK